MNNTPYDAHKLMVQGIYANSDDIFGRVLDYICPDRSMVLDLAFGSCFQKALRDFSNQRCYTTKRSITLRRIEMANLLKIILEFVEFCDQNNLDLWSDDNVAVSTVVAKLLEVIVSNILSLLYKEKEEVEMPGLPVMDSYTGSFQRDLVARIVIEMLNQDFPCVDPVPYSEEVMLRQPFASPVLEIGFLLAVKYALSCMVVANRLVLTLRRSGPIEDLLETIRGRNEDARVEKLKEWIQYATSQLQGH